MPEINIIDKDVIIEEQRRIIRSVRLWLMVPELHNITDYVESVMIRQRNIESAILDVVEYIESAMGMDDDPDLEVKIRTLKKFLKPL